MEKTVQMTKFEVHTYENLASAAELEIKANVVFTNMKELSNINVDCIKQALIQNLALQSVSFKQNFKQEKAQ